MTYSYKPISWWPGAYHVYNGEVRLGIVNERVVRTKAGDERPLWFAHDVNFFTMGKNYPSQHAATKALPINGKAKKRTSDEVAGIA